MTYLNELREIFFKKIGNVYTLLCQLSSVKLWLKEPMPQNICSDASRVQNCWNLAKTRIRSKKKIPALKRCIFK